jgi:protein-tyrosine phosphatase
MICREVRLPDGISGKLSICQMPGRTGQWQQDRDTFAALQADVVFCLTPLDEIETESPDYAFSIKAGSLPWPMEMLPTPDFGVMEDRRAFLASVLHAADLLRQGRKLVIQCGAGIGRSGTFALSVLMALGIPYRDAAQTVDEAGSHPETWSQQDLIVWAAEQLGQTIPESD